ncbi:MAG: TolC family protein [Flavobacteriales bacterium]|nr:TolC family protein [Flavobacteriales bacterium]
MKKHFPIIITLLMLGVSNQLLAQKLNLYACLDSAEKHMPLLKQEPILTEILQNKLKTYNRSYLPMVTANGQATYQSDVPELPFSFPGVPSIDIPKFQYRAYLELYQPVFDAGVSSAQKTSEKAQNEVSLMGLQVGLAEYKKQVAQLYFQMLLVDDQLAIIQKTLDLMAEREKSVKTALDNGVVQQNDHLKLQSEILNQEKKQLELQSAREGGMEVLSLLTGIDAKDSQLEIPIIRTAIDYTYTDNLELQLIGTRQKGLMATEKLLKARRLPRINAFGQAGFGAPNPYNIFNADLSGYGMVGLKATWNIWDWGKTSLDRKNLRLNSRLMDEQQNQKKVEIESRIVRMRSDNEKLTKALEWDQKMLQLRSQIRKNAEVQVEQGVLTPTAYLEEVLAEQLTELTRSVDQISLYQNQIMLQFETGILK